MTPGKSRVAVGLFAGIGGLELGLSRAGFEAALLVDNFEPAGAVLRERFRQAQVHDDVRTLRSLPKNTELLAAGFPCQDLSSVGPKVGIKGTRSSLVGEVFRLIEMQPVPWLILENVPFILDLDKGRALGLITSALEELGYRWAYRVIDAESFGLPQRRRRWFLVASLVGDPRAVLLASDAKTPDSVGDPTCFGFYWTEGKRALGWAPNSIPPLKCGSTIGVPSPPAIFRSDRKIVTPDLRDAERLQGFRADWTRPAETVAKQSFRWKLVGNAVSVRAAAWVANRIALNPTDYDDSLDFEIPSGGRWPHAGWGESGMRFASTKSEHPVWRKAPPIENFLKFPPKMLSARACRGFLGRFENGNLRERVDLTEALQAQIRILEAE